jgi:hypothetical protein
MSVATVSWSSVDAAFPAGTVAAGWLVSIEGPNGTSSTPLSAEGPVEFQLEAGDYIATVARLDAAGAVLKQVSTAFSITEPVTVVISVPEAVNVLVA